MAVCLPNSLSSSEQEHYSLLPLFKNKLSIGEHYSAALLGGLSVMGWVGWVQIPRTFGKIEHDLWPGEGT